MVSVKHGPGKTKFGPGVEITLTGDELALAIDAYLQAKGVLLTGARTIRYNGQLLNNSCSIYVDPAGRVIADGLCFHGSEETLVPIPTRWERIRK